MGCAQIAEGLGQISQASQGFMEQQRQIQTRQQTLDLSRKIAEKFGMPGFETYDPSLLNAMISMGSRMDTPEDKKLKMAQASYYTNPPVKALQPKVITTTDSKGEKISAIVNSDGTLKPLSLPDDSNATEQPGLLDFFKKASGYTHVTDALSKITGVGASQDPSNLNSSPAPSSNLPNVQTWKQLPNGKYGPAD